MFYVHLNKMIDCLNLDEIFQFETNGTTFNFHNYYDEPERLENEVLKK